MEIMPEKKDFMKLTQQKPMVVMHNLNSDVFESIKSHGVKLTTLHLAFESGGERDCDDGHFSFCEG